MLQPSLFITGVEVERVASLKFLGIHITEDWIWTLNTSQDSTRNLNKAGLPSQLQEQNREHLLSGLYSVEWKLLSRMQEGPALGGKDSQEDCGRT